MIKPYIFLYLAVNKLLNPTDEEHYSTYINLVAKIKKEDDEQLIESG